MKNSGVVFLVLIFLLCCTSQSSAQYFSNPGTNVGKKNLVVGVEYSQIMHTYDLDASEIPTSSERVKLKITAGLSEWLDIYIEGGGAGLLLDYKENDPDVSKNFDSDMNAGIGLGARIRLKNFQNSQTRVFLQGGGFYFKTDDILEWGYAVEPLTKRRDIKWADMYVGLGVVKTIDFIDLSFGIGYSQIKWWMRDYVEQYDSSTGGTINLKQSWRDSYESPKPVFGFIGLDFILPYEYKVSVQTGLTGMDDFGFSVSLSQGLEKD
ncbi:hypothetical protein ACFL47_10805 [Candidatus Latescibacterota bacterium]